MVMDLAADAAIMANVRAIPRLGNEVARVGGFLCICNPTTNSRHLSYALPDDGVAADDAMIDSVVAWFRNRDRLPRLEFLPSLTPGLEQRLLDRGFEIEERLPLMTCSARTLRDVSTPDGVELSQPGVDSPLFGEVVAMQHAAFEEPEEPGPANIERVRTLIAGGGAMFVARDTASGAVVGAAARTPIVGGAAEVTGVAVVPAWRRRGIAGAMVASIVRDALAREAHTVYLEAAPGADGAYRAAGFASTSSSVHMSLPDGDG